MELSKYFFLTVLIFIIMDLVIMLTNHNGLALRLMDLIFWLLLVATVLYLRESKSK